MGESRNLFLFFASGVAVVAMILLGVAIVWRAADQERIDLARRSNCIAIEQLKAIQRIAVAEDITASRAFLRENPAGIVGISAAVIEAGIVRDERTLRNLAPREC